jgi:hypothetical protein
MAFVKLDTGVLDSTLWVDRPCREIFITALLMAEPIELTESMPQFHVKAIEPTGFVVPPGWYGFVRAAGVGISNRALLEHEVGLAALERLGSSDPESRSKEYEGRRLVRVDGGYIVLNYFRYRDRDHTAADRQKRMRERKRHAVTSRNKPVTSRIADADADADAEKNKDTAAPLVLHENLPKESWEEWLTHRRNKRWPMDDVTLKKQLKLLVKYSSSQQTEMIDTAINAGWQGLFAPRGKPAPQKKDNYANAL